MTEEGTRTLRAPQMVDSLPPAGDGDGSEARETAQTANEGDLPFEIGFSFSPAGLLFPYHLGVAQKLQEVGLLTNRTPICGASAGALTAIAIGLELPFATMEDAIQRLCADCKASGTAGRLNTVLRRELDILLPDDAHEKLNSRPAPVIISYSSLSLGEPEGNDKRPYSGPALRGARFISNFRSKQDLIEVMCASCCVPFWFSGWPAVSCRGEYCVDGFFAVPQRFFGCPSAPAKRTIFVCPFSAKVVGLTGDSLQEGGEASVSQQSSQPGRGGQTQQQRTETERPSIPVIPFQSLTSGSFSFASFFNINPQQPSSKVALEDQNATGPSERNERRGRGDGDTDEGQEMQERRKSQTGYFLTGPNEVLHKTADGKNHTHRPTSFFGVQQQKEKQQQQQQNRTASLEAAQQGQGQREQPGGGAGNSSTSSLPGMDQVMSLFKSFGISGNEDGTTAAGAGGGPADGLVEEAEAEGEGGASSLNSSASVVPPLPPPPPAAVSRMRQSIQSMKGERSPSGATRAHDQRPAPPRTARPNGASNATAGLPTEAPPSSFISRAYSGSPQHAHRLTLDLDAEYFAAPNTPPAAPAPEAAGTAEGESTVADQAGRPKGAKGRMKVAGKALLKNVKSVFSRKGRGKKPSSAKGMRRKQQKTQYPRELPQSTVAISPDLRGAATVLLGRELPSYSERDLFGFAVAPLSHEEITMLAEIGRADAAAWLEAWERSQKGDAEVVLFDPVEGEEEEEEEEEDEEEFVEGGQEGEEGEIAPDPDGEGEDEGATAGICAERGQQEGKKERGVDGDPLCVEEAVSRIPHAQNGRAAQEEAGWAEVSRGSEVVRDGDAKRKGGQGIDGEGERENVGPEMGEPEVTFGDGKGTEYPHSN
uniref:PNPLA domain-containing protein n=1 Tax=Chromera velia CCMP2878 TaxID=1169474 RepID=A0A0G4HNV0_9ALVE|eukprot:Cvel_29681.t1-p1 / transcript=Cvel_29681.t1 / gene=Cvel_29681 / organism=Chromera_velia_CCMP2878 / gene_product=Patatin-like phospholipase domain-containing, putative / transcript_product=Patatin-like phospholipase domain-containing, putative / location=Cvel_scaffold4106:6178-10592(+) / protein_length=877 / sequence_SO=supercontig / SO=protein_coding / is_pseudo=false